MTTRYALTPAGRDYRDHLAEANVEDAVAEVCEAVDHLTTLKAPATTGTIARWLRASATLARKRKDTTTAAELKQNAADVSELLAEALEQKLICIMADT